MIIVLITSLFLVPWEIAFGMHSLKEDADKDSKVSIVHTILSHLMDLFFFTDLVITFHVAFITKKYVILDDRKDIAKQYLSSWFIVDLLSCIPYGLIGDIFLSS